MLGSLFALLFSPIGWIWLALILSLCVHVVRNQQPYWWLMIILMLPPLGPLAYLVAVVLPGWMGGAQAQRLGQAARDSLDPGREYREASQALAEAVTVHNQMRLARAAASLGRHAEAERLYADAAVGVHADDPVLLLGRAQALLELARPAEALTLLARLEPDGEGARAPAAALATARAYEGLGRPSDAEVAYRWAVERLPGLEALGRWASFLARQGRRDEAREVIAEMDRHIAKAAPAFRREGRAWRDLAARALSDA